MYCKNCEKELEEGTKYCPNCGAHIGVISTSNTQQKNENENKTKQKKNVSLPAIILSLMIFFGIIGAITANNISPTQTQLVSSDETTSDETVKNNNEPLKTFVTLDQNIEGKDWNITIKNVYFGQRIDPPNKPYFYNYYQVDDTSKTYLCIVLDAQNKSNLELRAEKAATVNVKYDNNYSYSSFSAIPDKNLGFTYTSITNIKPLTTDPIYYLAEMPQTAEIETDKPIEIEIKIDNTTYYYQYR